MTERGHGAGEEARRDIRPSRQRRSAPTMVVEACPEAVEGSSAAGALELRPDLRANVAKCRRMSHYFNAFTRKSRDLRVKNLTFLTKNRPFPTIFVHFRVRRAPSSILPPCEEEAGRGRGFPCRGTRISHVGLTPHATTDESWRAGRAPFRQARGRGSPCQARG